MQNYHWKIYGVLDAESSSLGEFILVLLERFNLEVLKRAADKCYKSTNFGPAAPRTKVLTDKFGLEARSDENEDSNRKISRHGNDDEIVEAALEEIHIYNAIYLYIYI